MNRKGFAPILIIGIIAIVILVGVAAWYFAAHKNAAAPAGVACTAEAKECPDGSYVGRTGPNCEFAACPAAVATSTIDTSGWKTYTSQQYGFAFQYPANWGNPIVQSDTIYFASSDPNAEVPDIKLIVSIADADGKTLDQAVSDDGTLYQGVAYIDIATTTLNGVSAKKFLERREGGFVNYGILEYGNYIYEISYGNWFAGDTAPSSTLESQAILSTFRFTSANTASATYSFAWKTYTNQQYGFTIQYPNDNQLVTDKGNAQVGFMYSPESCDRDTALACFSYKPDKFPGTNFNGSALSVNLITWDDDNGAAVTDAQTCSNFESNWDGAGTRIINGIAFRYVNSSDGAGGHVGSADDYIAFVNNHCFDVRIVSETISDYTDYGLTEMATTTQQWVSDAFDKMLSSFAIMK